MLLENNMSKLTANGMANKRSGSECVAGLAHTAQVGLGTPIFNPTSAIAFYLQIKEGGIGGLERVVNAIISLKPKAEVIVSTPLSFNRTHRGFI